MNLKQDPSWSPEEHLERVYRRGRQLRRRRQLGATSAAVAAVVGLAVMISGPTTAVLQPLRTVTGAGGGESSHDVHATDETSSTTSPETPGNTRQSDGAAAPTATTRHSATTTTAAAGPATTSVSTAGTTPPPTSPISDCKDLVWTTATNKSSYRGGDTVEISLHARNTGEHPCYAPRPCGVAISATVTNSEGAVVWQGPSSMTRCDFGTTAPMIAPRDSYSYGTAGSWNQVGPSGSRAPLGTYRAAARRGTTTANGATFALR